MIFLKEIDTGAFKITHNTHIYTHTTFIYDIWNLRVWRHIDFDFDMLNTINKKNATNTKNTRFWPFPLLNLTSSPFLHSADHCALFIPSKRWRYMNRTLYYIRKRRFCRFFCLFQTKLKFKLAPHHKTTTIAVLDIHCIYVCVSVVVYAFYVDVGEKQMKWYTNFI